MNEQHRNKIYDLYKDQSNTLIYIKGQSVTHRYSTDFEYPFRQESNFLYLTGVNEPDFALILNPSKREYHLLLPRRDATYAVWMGFVHSPEKYKKMYQPDHIHYTDELEEVFRTLKPSSVHCISESDATQIRGYGFNTNNGELLDALAFCRVLKTPDEIGQLRIASRVGGEAHKALMKSVAPGKMEYEMQALFDFTCTNAGLRHQPYSGIHAVDLEDPYFIMLRIIKNLRMAPCSWWMLALNQMDMHPTLPEPIQLMVNSIQNKHSCMMSATKCYNIVCHSRSPALKWRKSRFRPHEL